MKVFGVFATGAVREILIGVFEAESDVELVTDKIAKFNDGYHDIETHEFKIGVAYRGQMQTLLGFPADTGRPLDDDDRARLGQFPDADVNVEDLRELDGGHRWERTTSAGGLWCIRCGLSHSRWSGEGCGPEMAEHGFLALEARLLELQGRPDEITDRHREAIR